MDYKDLFSNMEERKNNDRAIKMSAYMRNQFEFLGIPTPERNKLSKEFFKEAKKETQVDWDFINLCWEKHYREYQYVAVNYLVLMQKYLTPMDVPKLKKLALDKSWWDTIDVLDKVIGNIALSYSEVNDVLLEWSLDDNFWLRRIAIDHQLLRKQKTNTELLEKIIVNNIGQTEFFINKAIGWSLRDYSKVNPEWVRDFIERYKGKLSPLSTREASKYI